MHRNTIQPHDDVDNDSHEDGSNSQQQYLLIKKKKRLNSNNFSGGDGFEKKATVVSTALLQCADVVGVGILTLPRALSQLGWIPGIFLLLVMCPINIYAGILISKARNIVPSARNYIDIARIGGNKSFTFFVASLYYSYIVMTLSSYLLALSKILSMSFFETELCQPTWGILAMIALTPLIQIRTLNASKVLLWVNFSLISISLLCTLGYMMYDYPNQKNQASTVWISKDFNWIEVSSVVSKITFAYLGCYVYLEMIAEMKEPKRFPEAFKISGPVQLGMYLSVSSIGYAYFGQNAHLMIVQAIPKDNILYRISTLCLFGYIQVAYLIKSTVLARTLHTIVCKRTVNATSNEAKFHWFLITTSILIVCYFLANAIPVFNHVVSILGSFQSSLLGYVLPAIFILLARNKAEINSTSMEKIAFTLLLLIGLFIFFIGTAANLVKIHKSYKAGNVPFACNPTA